MIIELFLYIRVKYIVLFFTWTNDSGLRSQTIVVYNLHPGFIGNADNMPFNSNMRTMNK